MSNTELENKLKTKDIKPTAVRLLVLKWLMEQTHAVSLKDLELHFDYADKSTLFRTLKTFEKKQLIHPINDETGVVKYALQQKENTLTAKGFHYHFYCIKCKETFCLQTVSKPKLTLPNLFTAQKVNTIVKGVCANCNN